MGHGIKKPQARRPVAINCFDNYSPSRSAKIRANRLCLADGSVGVRGIAGSSPKGSMAVLIIPYGGGLASKPADEQHNSGGRFPARQPSEPAAIPYGQLLPTKPSWALGTRTLSKSWGCPPTFGFPPWYREYPPALFPLPPALLLAVPFPYWGSVPGPRPFHATCHRPGG